MKTKTEKVLLISCIILVVTTIALAIAMFFYDFNVIVPNKEKFTVMEDDCFLPLDKYVGNGLFCVCHEGRSTHLKIVHDHKKDDFDAILSCVKKYIFENEILYCYADDGYAIVYPESNLCKVFITPPPNPFSERLFYSYARTEENNYKIREISPDGYPENKFVIYLDSFDEFTEYEQKMLKSLVGYKLW